MNDGAAPGAPFREPAAELLGFERLGTDAANGTARMAFRARPDFCNAMGVLQGGFVTAMLDQAMAEAGVAHLGWQAYIPTLEITVSFLRPALPGRLIGEGRVVRVTRSVIFLEGSLGDAAGTLLATASQTALIRPRRQPAEGS